VEQQGSLLTAALWLEDPLAPGATPFSTVSFDMDTSKAPSAFNKPLRVTSSTFTQDRTTTPIVPLLPLTPNASGIWWSEGTFADLGPVARRLAIGFPDAPASAAIIWDESTGHSPWEMESATVGASAVMFPKRLEFVAGPGIDIDLVDDGDGGATITIGLV
jgi:hypothetical protein